MVLECYVANKIKLLHRLRRNTKEKKLKLKIKVDIGM